MPEEELSDLVGAARGPSSAEANYLESEGYQVTRYQRYKKTMKNTLAKLVFIGAGLIAGSGCTLDSTQWTPEGRNLFMGGVRTAVNQSVTRAVNPQQPAQTNVYVNPGSRQQTSKPYSKEKPEHIEEEIELSDWQKGKTNLLPEYNIKKIQRNLRKKQRGIQDVFTYSDFLDLNGDNKKDLDELKIKRNFKEGEEINILTVWRYGPMREMTVFNGRIDTVYKQHNLKLKVGIYDEKGKLMEKGEISVNSPQKITNPRVFVPDENRDFSYKIKKNLPEGIYKIQCKLTNPSIKQEIKKGTIIKIIANEKTPVKVESDEKESSKK